MLIVKTTAMPARQVGKYTLKRYLRVSFLQQGLLKLLKPSISSVAISITMFHPSYYKMQTLLLAREHIAI